MIFSAPFRVSLSEDVRFHIYLVSVPEYLVKHRVMFQALTMLGILFLSFNFNVSIIRMKINLIFHVLLIYNEVCN